MQEEHSVFTNQDKSNDVFEAVRIVTREPFALAAATQLLTMRPLEVDVPFLLGAGTTRLGTEMALNCFHFIWVKALLAFAAELFKVNLIGSRNAPYVSTFPSCLAVIAMEIAVFLF